MSENWFGDGTHRWNARTLWKAAEGLPSSRVPVAKLLAERGSRIESLGPLDLLDEMRRVQRARLSFPLILTPDGFIADGWHRLLKAALRNLKFVRAVRLVKMPPPDGPDDGS